MGQCNVGKIIINEALYRFYYRLPQKPGGLGPPAKDFRGGERHEKLGMLYNSLVKNIGCAIRVLTSYIYS